MKSLSDDDDTDMTKVRRTPAELQRILLHRLNIVQNLSRLRSVTGIVQSYTKDIAGRKRRLRRISHRLTPDRLHQKENDIRSLECTLALLLDPRKIDSCISDCREILRLSGAFGGSL